MKTRTIFVIVGISITAMIFFILIDSGLGSYEGVQIERLSDDGFQRYYEDNEGNLNIVKITDDDLNQVPKIKNLIKKSLQQEFSLTTDYGGETVNNIQVFSSLATYEITHYQKWGENLGINTGRGMIAGSLLEYDGEYFHLKQPPPPLEDVECNFLGNCIIITLIGIIVVVMVPVTVFVYKKSA